MNNAKSKRCGACGFIYYFNPSAACVALIVNDKGELLVARRSHEPAKGTYDLPGGFTDPGETMEECVGREVAEETGLTVCASRYLFSLPNIYPYSGFEVHTMDCFFLCNVQSTDSLTPADDVATLEWIAWENLHPEKFGLLSVCKGVELLKKMLPL